MTDLMARIVAVFDTPAGMAVLGMAVLAFVALFVIAFWDTIRLPRRDQASGSDLSVAPPPLMNPTMVGRSAEGGWNETRRMWGRNAVLLGLGGLFAFAAFQFFAHLERPEVVTAGAASVAPTPSLAPAAPRQESAAATFGVPVDTGLCVERGSLEERFIETCANGASVRFDLMRLERDGRFVLRPRWQRNAPTFVGSDSHAAPFTLDGSVRFAAPETVRPPRYDGFLVVGVAETAAGTVATERARALRDFAITQLSGGDRSECLTSERVYMATATFAGEAKARLEALSAEVEALERRARRDELARTELAAKKDELAALRLEVLDAPGPIIVGITADPHSGDPDGDMRAAAARFLDRYGEGLQIASHSALYAIDACARHEAAL